MKKTILLAISSVVFVVTMFLGASAQASFIDGTSYMLYLDGETKTGLTR
jgi:hypothetical protein